MEGWLGGALPRAWALCGQRGSRWPFREVGVRPTLATWTKGACLDEPSGSFLLSVASAPRTVPRWAVRLNRLRDVATLLRHLGLVFRPPSTSHGVLPWVYRPVCA